jgi:type I restriction enzyme S subunit
MMKYDSYKKSEIEWLGDIPEHWNNHRVDWIATVVRGNTGFKKDELLNSGQYVALQYGKTYQVDEVDSTFQYFVNSDFYKRTQIVKRGNTILISTSETIEDLGHSFFYNRDDLGLVGGEQILVKPNRKLLIDKYLYYYSRKFCSELQKYATGLKVFRFNIDDLKQIFVAIPSLSEQTRIALHLDSKTTAIDRKIAILETKISHYKELHKSLVNEVVCKGLNKNVLLKDSGIEWVGEVPVHWQNTRMKDIYAIRKNVVGSNSSNYQLLSLTQNGVIVRNLEKNAGKFPAEFDTYQVVRPNDLVFCLFDLDVTPRTVGISYNKGMITGAYTILSSKTKKVLNQYYYYLYLMIDNSKKLSLHYTGLRNTIKKETFLSLPVVIPPMEEQQAIAEYLYKKTKTINAIVANIKLQIDSLKELRKSLINDVVTGKLKVTE